MSEQEKKEAIVTSGEVTEAKTTWYKKLWNNPTARKIVKGIGAAAACVGSAVIGYKAGLKNGAAPLPAEGTVDETEEENDAE